MINSINETLCTGCGLCVKKCPLDVFRLKEVGQVSVTGMDSVTRDDRKAYIAYPEDCMTCYCCELNCDYGAIDVHPFKEKMPRAY